MVEKHREALREIAFCFSLAGLILIEEWAFLNWALEAVYPTYPVRWGDITVFLIALSALALPFWLLLKVSARYPRLQHWIVFGFAILLLAPINYLRHVTNFSVRYPLFSATGLAAQVGKMGAIVVAGILFLAVGYVWRRYGGRSRAAFQAVVLCGFPFLLLSFGKLVVSVVARSSAEVPLVVPSVKREANSLRAVWVIFDEWDYSLTYEKLPKAMRLWELEALKKQSFFATQAYSPEIHTHASLPAYLVGRQVASFCRMPGNDISVLFPPLAERRKLSLLPTVLSAAAEDGKAVSVTGWYHPYCHFLPREKLARCEADMYYEYGRPGELLPRLASLGLRVVDPKVQPPSQHLDNYQHLKASALRDAADPAIDFAFIHLSIPHLPGIYDRHRKRLVTDRKAPTAELDDYISNVALVSRTLGEMIQKMRESGVWDRTVLLVTSDHSIHAWRWNLKNPDRRVPFLLRVPGQSAQISDRPFNTVLSGVVLRELLSGKLDPSQVSARIEVLGKIGPVETGSPEDACPANEM